MPVKKRVLLLIIALGFIVIIIGLLFQNSFFNQSASKLAEVSLPLTTNKKTITIDQTKIYIDIADTNEKRRLGLSGRSNLGQNHGMFFIFDRTNIRPVFWMKGMKFGIDIIWIKNGKVSQIHTDIPPPEPETAESKLPLYQPYDSIDYVLEVNAGFVEKNGITVGDPVDLSNL